MPASVFQDPKLNSTKWGGGEAELNKSKVDIAGVEGEFMVGVNGTLEDEINVE